MKSSWILVATSTSNSTNATERKIPQATKGIGVNAIPQATKGIGVNAIKKDGIASALAKTRENVAAFRAKTVKMTKTKFLLEIDVEERGMLEQIAKANGMHLGPAVRSLIRQEAARHSIARKDPSIGQQLYARWCELFMEVEPGRFPSDWSGLQPNERIAWDGVARQLHHKTFVFEGPRP